MCGAGNFSLAYPGERLEDVSPFAYDAAVMVGITLCRIIDRVKAAGATGQHSLSLFLSLSLSLSLPLSLSLSLSHSHSLSLG
jgi:hypothetical protein